MFGSVTTDRHALLLVAGLSLAAAYVAGGAAVASGLHEAIVEQAGRLDEGARLAFSGPDLFASPGFERTPEGDVTLLVARVVDISGHYWMVGALPDAPARGLGRNVAESRVEFEGGLVAEGVVELPIFPRGWVLLTPDDLRVLSPQGVGRAILVPVGGAAPEGATVVSLAALPDFVLAGGAGVSASFALLVVASSFVAVVLAGSLTKRAVEAHSRDLYLYRTLGASSRDVRMLVARWIVRVVVLGIFAGTSFGIVAAYAVFSFGNRAGLRAPVVPAPEPVTLGLALSALAVAALVAGTLAGWRLVARLDGSRLEAVS